MKTDVEVSYQLICSIFENVIRSLGARAIILDSDEVFIISKKVLLWLPVDRDGLDLWYVRQRACGEFQAYRLGMFLANRAARSGITIKADITHPMTWLEELAAGAQWSVKLLETLGQDVLAGDQIWIQEYERDAKPFPLRPPIATALHQALV